MSSRTLQLKVQFYNLKKGVLSINDYVHYLKSISDTLISFGNPIFETDLVLQILSGLPLDYISVSTSISTRVPLTPSVETRSLLFLHESQLNNFSQTNSDFSPTTLVVKQQSLPHGRLRGRHQNGGRNSTTCRGRGRQKSWVSQELLSFIVILFSSPILSFYFRTSTFDLPSLFS